MRKRLWAATWILVAVALATPAVTQTEKKDLDKTDSIRDKLIGSWRLAWVEEQSSDRKAVRPERTGIIRYAREGHMSVQIMLPEHEPGASSNPVQYEQGVMQPTTARMSWTSRRTP
jgi:hypothetical protein